MTSIKSPWGATFDQFVGSIRESGIIAAPYITRRPVERLVRGLGGRRDTIKLNVLTSLHPDHLIDGALDADALSWLCKRVPGTSVRHLRYLHAKAYVADEHMAIVTSSNLTNGGIWRNHELGVAVTDPKGVREIADDLEEYGRLGVSVSESELAELSDLARLPPSRFPDAVDIHAPGTSPGRGQAYDAINEKLITLRTAGEDFVSNPDGSVTAQFAEAVVYVLRRQGPLPTSELGPLVRYLKPELCDDEMDRVINGRAFGKRWKHDIRNAQQQLKRDGKIVLENRKWRMIQDE